MSDSSVKITVASTASPGISRVTLDMNLGDDQQLLVTLRLAKKDYTLSDLQEEMARRVVDILRKAHPDLA